MTIFDQLSLSLSIEVMLLQYTSSNLQRNEKHSSLNQLFLPAFFINFMTCIKSGSHTIVNLCFLMEHFLRSTTRMLLGFEAQSKVVYFCSKMNNWAY
uniref:Putative ovule protein n=1 Tax=Solanum chacoense TaxID=4108 RepID=A0A0V0HEX8_SOLCH